jgi:KDO2-lipid IV(A) lauroyltransferase
VTLFSRIRQRFVIRGLFWRQFLAWSQGNLPHYLEPLLMNAWSLFFFLAWKSGRRSVVANMRVINPGPIWLVYLRAYRVFWNFASTFTDTINFSIYRTGFDWQVDGTQNLERMRAEDRAIVLTAHMGNYDLGSYFFADQLAKSIVIVRAAEADRESDEHSRAHRQRSQSMAGSIRYYEPTSDLAIALVSALQDNQFVAIQGDRAIDGVASREAKLFGRDVRLPAGPFALALATGAPIFPLFVVRDGRRQYRVVVGEPFAVEKTGRDRNRDIDQAMAHWSATLEKLLRSEPTQWFTFFRFFDNAAA